jgi:hypothetical protein
MSWPLDNVTTVNLDASTDDPSLARVELKTALDTLKSILAEVTVGKTIWHTGNLIKASNGARVDNFIAGTVLTFRSTNAPVGWTKITTYNNMAFRLVNGTVGVYTGGLTFSSAFQLNKPVSTEYLQAAQCALLAHTHKMFDAITASGGNVLRNNPTYQAATDYNDGSYNNVVMGASTGAATHGDTSSVGGAVSASPHNHSISLDVSYIDLIIASKAV